MPSEDPAASGTWNHGSVRSFCVWNLRGHSRTGLEVCVERQRHFRSGLLHNFNQDHTRPCKRPILTTWKRLCRGARDMGPRITCEIGSRQEKRLERRKRCRPMNQKRLQKYSKEFSHAVRCWPKGEIWHLGACKNASEYFYNPKQVKWVWIRSFVIKFCLNLYKICV